MNMRHLKDRLQPLVGAKLESIEIGTGNDAALDLILRLPDGRSVLLGVWRDPEGNGPGWLDIAGPFTDAELRAANQ
jgi:hypothetical protein